MQQYNACALSKKLEDEMLMYNFCFFRDLLSYILNQEIFCMGDVIHALELRSIRHNTNSLIFHVAFLFLVLTKHTEIFYELYHICILL